MKIRVTQTGSMIGQKEPMKRTLKALGLGRISKTRIHEDNDVIRGMVGKVSHLVKVEPVEGE